MIENIPNSSENFRALKVLEKSYKALGYEDLREDVLKIIQLNYSDKNISESNDSEWSWNFLRNSKGSSFFFEARGFSDSFSGD